MKILTLTLSIYFLIFAVGSLSAEGNLFDNFTEHQILTSKYPNSKSYGQYNLEDYLSRVGERIREFLDDYEKSQNLLPEKIGRIYFPKTSSQIMNSSLSNFNWWLKYIKQQPGEKTQAIANDFEPFSEEIRKMEKLLFIYEMNKDSVIVYGDWIDKLKEWDQQFPDQEVLEPEFESDNWKEEVQKSVFRLQEYDPAIQQWIYLDSH